ncbi:hypothetical protein ABID21_002551 [Pseudorhizobium tarimense]|uniref:Uncharacterized protein n=1 Tax=Pseudorhizobium tarimense TaxID=1079109 RepID=A0ABV2H7A9_9HYPH|nr:hypothetical protein [Pseudorhizobium tarimense]MCJ8519722.1 hypothetical protein [Pseudorhizobium tarimense]
MQISLTNEEIESLAKSYSYADDVALGHRMTEAQARGSMTLEDLQGVATWKWRGGRTRNLVSENSAEDVQEITRVAFSATSERLKMGALLALRGVDWPMASVILHFAFPDHYPILDVRAMNSVGGSTNYTFSSWMEYVALCRDKARAENVTLRTLDRTLWSADKMKVPRRQRRPRQVQK